MTTMNAWMRARAEAVERVHPLLELDRAQLLGGALGRLAVEERLDDAVDEDAGEAHGDDGDDDDEQDGQQACRGSSARDLRGSSSRAWPTA